MKLHKLYDADNGALFVRGSIDERHLKDVADYVIVALADPSPAVAVHAKDYYYRPIADGQMTPTTKVDVWEAVKLVVNLVRQGEQVIVHCHAGRNRAGVVGCLAYRELQGVSGTEALEHLRRVRGPMSQGNQAFEDYTRSLP